MTTKTKTGQIKTALSILSELVRLRKDLNAEHITYVEAEKRLSTLREQAEAANIPWTDDIHL